MTFMQSVFSKKFRSPSSDLITVFAGLAAIDEVFFNLLDHLSFIIKRRVSKEDSVAPFLLGIQVNSIRAATIAAGGAYQTSLASYFINRDIFASIMAFIDMDGVEDYIGDAFSLIGILASYDKLEAQNPYHTRLSDFVDHQSMTKSIQASGHVWEMCWDAYTRPAGLSVQTPTVSQVAYKSIASWVGLGQADASSGSGGNNMPLEIISLTLATYEFINANNVFARLLLETPATDAKVFKSAYPPFVNFLSLSTYLFQNQHKTTNAALYARLHLLILRLLVEAPSSSSVTMLLLSDDLKTKGINVCRQRAPNLPLVSEPRLLIEGVLDAIQCALRYNMKASLDTDMYNLAFTVLFQVIHLLRANKYKLSYIWSELWKTIISLVKFINSHPPSTNAAPAYEKLSKSISLVLASALIHGDDILSDTKDYEDLLYKFMESSVAFEKFNKLFPGLASTPSMSVINAAINHYKKLLQEQPGTAKKSFFSFVIGGGGATSASAAANTDLTPQKVSEIIRKGFDTLSLHQYVSKGGSSGGSFANGHVSKYQEEASHLLYDPLPRYSEGSERLFLKRISRQVIVDVQKLHSNLQ